MQVSFCVFHFPHFIPPAYVNKNDFMVDNNSMLVAVDLGGRR